MECLKFYEFFNNLMGLPLIIENGGKASRKGLKTLGRFYQRISELIVFLGVTGQILAVPSVWIDMNVLCGCLASGTHSIQVLLKTGFLNFYKGEFIKYLDAMESFRRRSESFEDRNLKESEGFSDYYRRSSKYVRWMLVTHFVITFCSTSAYFLPFVYDSLINYERVESQSTPIVLFLPMEYHWTPMFQIIVLFLTICFYFNNLKTVAIDNFILSLIVLTTSHFRYHKKLLNKCIDKYFPENESLGEETSLTLEKKKIIIDWIISHQELLKAARVWGNIMSPYLLLEFSYVLIHTCVPAFVITSTFSWTVAQKMAVFFIVGGGLIQLLLMSKAGDAFTHSWESIDADLLLPNLYRREQRWMLHVYTIIKSRLREPFRLSAYELFPLKSTTFATITEQAYPFGGKYGVNVSEDQGVDFGERVSEEKTIITQKFR